MNRIPQMQYDANQAAEFVKGQTNALLTPYALNLNSAGSTTINLQGNFIYVTEASDTTAAVSIQFNRQSSDGPALTLTKSYGFVHPFTRVYISWEAQTGKTMTLLIGSFAKDIMDVIDNRSQVDLVATLEEILAELQGSTVAQNWGIVAVSSSAGGTEVLAANTSRKSAKISAHPSNTDVIYVGYDDTVSNIKYCEILGPGDVFSLDDYRGAIYCISAVNGEIVAVSEV